MRKFSSSLMVALAVVAMLWGNCLSCPDMMAAMAAHQPDHSCCHKHQPASAKCHTQGMQHFVQADAAPHGLPVVAEVAELPAAATLRALWNAAPSPAEYAPPGIPIIPISLRV